jgi:hypothetical protein
LKGKLGNFVFLGGEVGTDLWGEQEVEDLDFFGFFDEVLGGGKLISLGGKLPLHSPLGLIPRVEGGREG